VHDAIAIRWLAASIGVPFILGLVVAWPLWRRPSRDPVGSVAAAGIALAFAVVFVGREYIHVERVTRQCLTLEVACQFSPEPYARFFLYVAIAMAQTFALFLIGARIEDRRRESEVASPWRR
jgi:hypothetical protein